jgi:hypothetical protein
VQDIVGAPIAAGTGITVTYNDVGNVETIALAVQPPPTSSRSR